MVTHLLLRKALYLANVREISAELIPVPTTQEGTTQKKRESTTIN